MRNLPSPFHLKALWTAIAAVSITITVAIVVGVIFLGTQIISFLQPILIPFAVAGVLAYLLEPVVNWLGRKWKLSRHHAVLLVFSVMSLVFAGVVFLVVPALIDQGAEFKQEVPGYAEKARTRVSNLANEWHAKLKKDYGIEVLDFLGGAKKETTAKTSNASTPTLSSPAPSTSSPATPPASVEPSPDKDARHDAEPTATTEDFDFNELLTGAWIKDATTQALPTAWNFIRRSMGGFLGVFGFLLSFVIVPLYLYYFLTESAVIAARWHDYVPLRASHFKDEVVGTLSEINRYLIAFFRGQLVVSLINGIATGLGLVIVGLKFGWLIGLGLCLLGMIPYLGILLCMIPAVIIASVQGGCWMLPADWPWWSFPVLVMGIFTMVQQIDGLFITPKIVGESVGLHPMTVIVSVFVWSLIMGGLLGAILAVPMTASIKVLFQRYVWQARFAPAVVDAPEV